MKKPITLVKVLVFCILIIGCASSTTGTAQSSQPTRTTQTARNAIQGAWEIQTERGVYVISFLEDVFTVFTRNGDYVLGGIYHTGIKSPWGLTSNTRNPRHTRNLFLMYDLGLGLAEMGFAYEISSNRLTLSSDGFNNSPIAFITNNLSAAVPIIFPSSSDTPVFSILSGTYRKTSFTEPTGRNPPIGLWKVVFNNGTQFIRFFSPRAGEVYTIIPEDNFFAVGPFNYTYGSGNGRYTFVHGGQSFSFTVRGNVLIRESEGFTSEFIRQ